MLYPTGPASDRRNLQTVPIEQRPSLLRRDCVGTGRKNLNCIEAEFRGLAAALFEVPEDKRPPARLGDEADGDGGLDHSSSTIALMTPVSGFVYAGKFSATASKAQRWVIHGLVSIFPSSISLMIRLKSAGRALREA